MEYFPNNLYESFIPSNHYFSNFKLNFSQLSQMVRRAKRYGYGGFGGYTGEGDMRKLTEQTGGRVINVGNKFDKLREAFDQIAAELRSQYNIGYAPTNDKLDGTYRKLEIKTKEQGYKIQSRAGYYATARSQD